MNSWIQVTGWTLMHFVWQGALLAAATAAGMRLLRHRSSEARYAMACCGLAAMLVVPVTTGAVLRSTSPSVPAGALSTGSDMGIDLSRIRSLIDRTESSGDTGGRIALRLEPWLPAVVWTWLFGVAILLGRFGGACWRVHRLKAASRAEALSRWHPACERLASRLHVDVAFRVVESTLVDAPSVIGVMRPVILLPVAALVNLTPMQVEALLAHELAHVRRQDYLVNLLQTLAEVLLFFHPGVWLVSGWVRREREHCCDDVAVSTCGEPESYASALAELASWRASERALALGASDGSLLSRVRRLLGERDDDAPRPASVMAVLICGLSLVVGLAVQSSASTPQTSAARPEAPEYRVLTTDHFEISYPSPLDVHAERAGKEAERAYEKVSGDLRHNLGERQRLVLVQKKDEIEATRGLLPDPGGHRIFFPIDQPADSWFGTLTHELTHVFMFDIIPGNATPVWISEGLAEYERGAWDPGDVVLLRDAVRGNAIPKLSAIGERDLAAPPRMAQAAGHAAFDMIESRWQKAGVRQFLLMLRRAAQSGGDPFESAFKMNGGAFDQAFESYVRGRFTAADQSLAGRFDTSRTIQVEGQITAMHFPVPEGLACMELLLATDVAARERWAVECRRDMTPAFMGTLRPGQNVVVTGAPSRSPELHRLLMQNVQQRP